MLQYLKYDIPDFIKDYIKKCTQKDNHSINGKLNGKRLKLYLTPEIQEWQSQNNNIPFTVIKKMLITGDYNHPVCQTCGKVLPIEKYGTRFCSNQCLWKSTEVQEKYKNTCIERFGTDNPLKSDEIKEKSKQTNLEKYGVTSYTKTQGYKEKTKKTNLERYGTEWSQQNTEVRNKGKSTCIERYGTNHPWKNADIRKKAKKTILDRYGVVIPLKSDELKEKLKQTNLEKYNCEWTLQSSEVRRKSSIAFRKRYYNTFIQLLEQKNIELVTTYDEYVDLKDILTYRCKRCGTVFETEKSNPQTIYCEKCHKDTCSGIEKKLVEYVKSITQYDIIENDRTILNGKELDIYIPEKKLAIEFNGDYWHTEHFVSNKYHQEKTLECQKLGIRLIHIFEYEWNNKQEICKSIIKSALGIYDKKIYARKCIVKEISSNDYRDFLDLNHLQGSVNSSIRFGLFYNNELVAVIGFGKSRFKKDEMELHRFCCKLNYSIPGAFSKLIKHSNVSNFITYVDLAHFTGDSYKKNGFKEIAITNPNYKWIKNHFVLSRNQAQKHKLSELLAENYNEDYTESQNMLFNGYTKIYDCGNLKLIF